MRYLAFVDILHYPRIRLYLLNLEVAWPVGLETRDEVLRQQFIAEPLLKPLVNPKGEWMWSSVSVLDNTDFQRTGRKSSQRAGLPL